MVLSILSTGRLNANPVSMLNIYISPILHSYKTSMGHELNSWLGAEKKSELLYGLLFYHVIPVMLGVYLVAIPCCHDLTNMSIECWRGSAICDMRIAAFYIHFLHSSFMATFNALIYHGHPPPCPPKLAGTVSRTYLITLFRIHLVNGVMGG